MQGRHWKGVGDPDGSAKPDGELRADPWERLIRHHQVQRDRLGHVGGAPRNPLDERVGHYLPTRALIERGNRGALHDCRCDTTNYRTGRTR